MAKTKEELNALKEEIETVSNKLVELTEKELKQVTGGVIPVIFSSYIQNIIGSKVEFSSDINKWKSDTLPTDTGNFNLGVDVELDDKWIPDPGNTKIDK